MPQLEWIFVGERLPGPGEGPVLVLLANQRGPMPTVAIYVEGDSWGDPRYGTEEWGYSPLPGTVEYWFPIYWPTLPPGAYGT